jgi:hypothetical protein
MVKRIAVVLIFTMAISPLYAGNEERALLVGQTLSKIVRLESVYNRNGRQMPETLVKADVLFLEFVNSFESESAVEYVKGNKEKWLGRLVDLASELPPPPVDDISGKIIAALKASEDVSPEVKNKLDGYGAEFLVVIESRREIRVPLAIAEVLPAVGLPITLSDLGLKRDDYETLKKIAEEAGEGDANERGSEAYVFYSAMLDLDDLGGRFGSQQDETDLADRVMTKKFDEELSEKLKSLPSSR